MINEENMTMWDHTLQFPTTKKTLPIYCLQLNTTMVAIIFLNWNQFGFYINKDGLKYLLLIQRFCDFIKDYNLKVRETIKNRSTPLKGLEAIEKPE